MWFTTLNELLKADPHFSPLRRMHHLYSAGLPPECLVKLQFWNRLCIDTRNVQQPIMPGTILRCDSHARMHSITAAVHPPLHYRNRLPAQ